MNRLKNILVGIDFSDHSLSALEHALRFAHWHGAKVHMVNVIDTGVIMDLNKMLGVLEGQLRHEVRSTVRDRLHEALKGHDTEGITVKSDVLIGNSFYEMAKRVNDLRADLLILGANGAYSKGPGVGSLAGKCVRKAATKVLLVREEHSHPYRQIVACIDFSATSKRVVDQAVRVARQDGSAIHFTHVYRAPWKTLHYMSQTRQASPDYQRQFLDALNGQLHQFVAEHAESLDGIESEYELVEHSDYAEGIIETVKRIDADLTIIGTRGRTKMKSLIVGTTAERVVQDSPSSVLAIKPDNFRHNLN